MIETTGKKLLKIPGVSKLKFSDESIFRKAFLAKDSIQYAKSWLYLLRASHCKYGREGYKFVSKELLAIIGYRHNIIYITPIVDETKGLKLEKLCQEISHATNYHIILKKYSRQSYPYIKCSQNEQPIKNNLLEDDSCPETILKLQKLFITQDGKINPSAKKFIKKIKRFEKLNIQYDIINDITHISQHKITHFLNKDPEKYASFAGLIKYLYLYGKDARYKVMIFLQNKKVQGLYISENFSLTEAGLYCAVTAKDKPGITEWMDYYFFRQLFIRGTLTVYFGGSESKGIENYIAKLLPSKPDYNVSAILYCNTAKNTNRFVNNLFQPQITSNN